uniref:apoptosis-associated speck-like protein containing a CARD n=1 Tax=Scatophagus argus TaxID=75038 RepID=UPI001ED84C6E|nr:apoptosis-associated speck-like protein containing a CARD [Scatophagus argus]
MPPKTIKKAIKDALENLSQNNLRKFRDELLDRREEPRVKRSQVEDKSFLEITDVLVSTYTESGALPVTVELLREIGCSDDADKLVNDTRELLPKPDTARLSAGAAGVNTMADGEHFVDKYQLELIQRVGNIGPILDELLSKKIIQGETYNKIRALPTSQEKMRELYCGALQAGSACKDIFLKILEKNEPFLIEDLRGKK